MRDILTMLVNLLSYNNHLYTSSVVIKSVEYLNYVGKDYICAIKYDSSLYKNAPMNIYENWIRDYLLIRNRNINLNILLSER